jgi:hypothetical protein
MFTGFRKHLRPRYTPEPSPVRPFSNMDSLTEILAISRTARTIGHDEVIRTSAPEDKLSGKY